MSTHLYIFISTLLHSRRQYVWDDDDIDDINNDKTSIIKEKFPLEMILQ
jgi:hypothetical protein